MAATILHDSDVELSVLDGQRVAVIGYGNQGRSWALNLRDSGLDVFVCVRADATRDQASADGFEAHDLDAANDADVICAIVPDDAVPTLPLAPGDDALVIVASGYPLAFDRVQLDCDLGMVAPRMLGPEVRRCYEEGVGFITAFGVHQDTTGTARDRTLAIAKGIGGLKQGAIELSPMQEAVLDIGVEQALSPALRAVNQAFTAEMMARGIPLEAVMTELFLSGEVERTYRLMRLEGYAKQMEHHSPVSQYGQLKRRDEFAHLDVRSKIAEIIDEIESGRFADEWDAERDAGYPEFERLKADHVGPEMYEFDADLRRRLGELAVER